MQLSEGFKHVYLLVFVCPSNISVKFVMLEKAQIGPVSNMIVNEFSTQDAVASLIYICI